jgi:hypothetical protein
MRGAGHASTWTSLKPHTSPDLKGCRPNASISTIEAWWLCIRAYAGGSSIHLSNILCQTHTHTNKNFSSFCVRREHVHLPKRSPFSCPENILRGLFLHSSRLLVACLPPQWGGLQCRSGHVGFVLDRKAQEVFSKYDYFPCQLSFPKLHHKQ